MFPLMVRIRVSSMRRNGMWLVILMLTFLALAGGCTSETEDNEPVRMTYVIDRQVEDLVAELARRPDHLVPADFNAQYAGLTIPWQELEREPLVLALATKSPIPAILLLDAPWVKRYGRLGWLQDLTEEGMDMGAVVDQAPPSILEAFSVAQSPSGPKAVMACPLFVKGNVLFYRKDLLREYGLNEQGPRTWDELIHMTRVVMNGERSKPGNRLKYGLIFHINNVENDFYPILWGFGAEVFGSGQVLLRDHKSQAVKAMTLLTRFVQTGDQGERLGFGVEDFEPFKEPQALRQIFRRGEALFMINWNTRLGDLKALLAESGAQPEGLTDLKAQVGWAPIPYDGAHDHRYVNIGSFGWGLNREALSSHEARQAASRFLQVISSVDLQYLAAVRYGQIPSRSDAIERLKSSGEAPDVVSMFENVFGLSDVSLKARPYRRDVNNIMAECTLMALQGQLTPEQAVDRAISELEKVVAQ